jgi:hypothetical protein
MNLIGQHLQSDILAVLRQLIRGRLPVERVAGNRWGWLEDALAYAEFSGLVIVELPGGELARLLYHQGALVYLAWKERTPVEVAEKIQRTAMLATFSAYPFDEARQTLAVAAVDGVIVRAAEPLEAHSTDAGGAYAAQEPPAKGAPPYEPFEASLRDLWKEFQRRHFSGVLALEDRAALHITLFQEGEIKLSTSFPAGFEPTRQTLITWTKRIPATLNLSLQPIKPWPSSELPAATTVHNEAVWNLVHGLLETHLGFWAGLVEFRLRREFYHLEADLLIESLVTWLIQNKHPGIAKELRQQLSRVQYQAFFEHFE